MGPRMTRRHTADACRARPSTRRLALPRRGSLHALPRRPGVLRGQPRLRGDERSVGHELLSEAGGRLSRMATKLVGHPPRERDVETLDDRHHVIRHADGLVWHVRMKRTSRPFTVGATSTTETDVTCTTNPSTPRPFTTSSPGSRGSRRSRPAALRATDGTVRRAQRGRSATPSGNRRRPRSRDAR